MTESRRERDARLDNLLTRVLLAPPEKRNLILRSEILHHPQWKQLADAQTLIVTLTRMIDRAVDAEGNRAQWEADLLKRLVNGTTDAST